MRIFASGLGVSALNTYVESLALAKDPGRDFAAANERALLGVVSIGRGRLDEVLQ